MPDDFGTRLRAARHSAELSQIQLARGIVTTAQLSLLESGQRRPSIGHIDALAARLTVPVAQLRPGLGPLWPAGLEGRLEQADRANLQHNFATAERLATGVLGGQPNPERRVHAYRTRACAREGQRRFGAALRDLQLALDIARTGTDTRLSARIAFDCARLRKHLHMDEAA